MVLDIWIRFPYGSPKQFIRERLKMNRDYDRGFFAGIEEALNLINTIEEQGHEFRKQLYQKLMEARPSKDNNGELVKWDNI